MPSTFSTAVQLGQRIAVAPVDDRGGNLLRLVALGTDCLHQRSEQDRIGLVEFNLAGFVHDANLKLGTGEVPAIRTTIGYPAHAGVGVGNAHQRVLDPGPRKLLCFNAAAKHFPLQAFNPRSQREGADERGQQRNQPQHQQQGRTARAGHGTGAMSMPL
jgi:hypothetical protein